MRESMRKRVIFISLKALLLALLGLSLTFIMIDFYEEKDLYIMYNFITGVTSSKNRLITSWHSPGTMYFFGFSKDYLLDNPIPLCVIEPFNRSNLARISVGNRFFYIDYSRFVYEAYKIVNGKLTFTNSLYSKSALDPPTELYELNLSDGLYLVKTYVLMPRFPIEKRIEHYSPLEFCKNVDTYKILISYKVVRVRNGNIEYLEFSLPSLYIKTLYHEYCFRVKVIPPWYALARLISLYAFPAFLPITLLILLKSKSKREFLLLSIIITLLILYLFRAPSINVVDYYLYAFSYYLPKILKYVPSITLPRIEYAEKGIIIHPWPSFSKIIHNKTLTILGFEVYAKLRINDTLEIRPVDLLNDTAIEFLRIFCNIMNTSIVGIHFIHVDYTIKSIEAVNCMKENGVYLFNITDLESVVLKIKKVHWAREGITAELSFQIGIPYKIDYVVKYHGGGVIITGGKQFITYTRVLNG